MKIETIIILCVIIVVAVTTRNSNIGSINLHFYIFTASKFSPSSFLLNLLFLSAFDGWKEEQIDEKSISAVFCMLSEDQKILPKFPVEYVRPGLPNKSKKVT